MAIRIVQGDCLQALRGIEDESVECCVTSPPYWALRNYHSKGQIGLERTPQEYIEKLVEVFHEVRRVLRKDGVTWIIIGDTYATGGGKVGKCPGGGDQGERFKRTFGKHVHDNNPRIEEMTQPNRMRLPGLKAKELIGIPWMLAFALRDDGWMLRSECIWHKPNGMVESVKDRPTRSHETVFLFFKSRRYYYDSAAIEEPQEEHERTRRLREQKQGLKTTYRLKRDDSTGLTNQGEHGGARSVEARQMLAQKGTRNKRSVWKVATEPSGLNHHATYPKKLIEPCILAGCPAGGTVLDPFGGAGTTGLVADKHGRNAILIELNPEYAAMAEKRIWDDCPLFADIEYSKEKE